MIGAPDAKAFDRNVKEESTKEEVKPDKLDIMVAYVKATIDKSTTLLTISEVATKTGLSKSTIERIKDDIGYVTFGGRYMLKIKDVDIYIEDNYTRGKFHKNNPRK